MKIIVFFFYFSLFLISQLFSNSPGIIRPPVWGIAKMTFFVSDFKVAREYYGNFLGYSEAFSYSSKLGEVLSFKVNDHQFLEFIEDKDAKRNGFLASVSFECDEIGQMEDYLLSKKVEIINKEKNDGSGNQIISIQSTEFYQIEFIKFQANGLHKLSKGKYLSENRVACRLHHAGLYISDIKKADLLYKKILGFNEMWRYKEDNTTIPNFIYLHFPDCSENIEYIFTSDSDSSHPCFCVDNMQQAIYNLKERRGQNVLGKPGIGKGNRWLMNMRNTDGARIEFTESFTIR